MSYPIHDPLHQVSVLQQCLSGGKKRIGILLGAGCPMAIPGEGQEPLIPDIAGITKSVRDQLTSSSEFKVPYGLADEQLKKDGISKPTVEHLLTHIRALRAVAGSDTVRGLSAEQLDALTRIHRWTGMDGVRTLEVGRGSNTRGWSGLEFG